MRTVLWTGSRGWRDVDTIIDTAMSLRRPYRSIVGDAAGWDSLVWEVLAEYGLPRWRFKPHWKELGRAAGHVRNHLMLDWLQRIDPNGFVLAGWDGQSPGTKGCMDEAAKRGIVIWPVMFVPELN
jgi:hypothetical protein